MATPRNRSVMKAFSLLQSFDDPDEWLTSSELSRRAKLPEASGYRLVQTLEGIGAVVRDARGRYRPGMLLLTLSQGVVARDLWGRVPQGLLNTLARDLGTPVHVGIIEEGMVSYVARAGRQGAGLPFKVGMQFEAYCTALGKMLLASMGEPALDAFLADGELVPLTANTIVDRDALRRHLAHARDEEMALDDGEMMEALSCVAVPIRNFKGRVVAAISASDDTRQMGEDRRQELRRGLSATATAISERLFPWRSGLPAGAPFAGEPRSAVCTTLW